MMNRKHRRIIACLTVGLLLFAQFAVAGYVCPNPHQDAAHAVGSPVVPNSCHGNDQQNLNLCKQHCERLVQSVDNRVQAKLDLPALPVVLAVGESDFALPTRGGMPTELSSNLATPPLYIHHCRFLI